MEVVVTFTITLIERVSRVTFRTFDSADGCGVVAGGVARAVRDMKNAVSDREAAGGGGRWL